MSMTKVAYGLAALPLLAGVALAETPRQSNDSKALAQQPMQLSEQQMDKVTAGWDIYIFEHYNTGNDYISVYETKASAPIWGANNTILPGTPAVGSTPAVPNCAACYLYIENRALSVGSVIFAGPVN